MNAMRIALIGLGDVGRAYLEALQSDRQFEVAAVSDTSDERLRGLADSLDAKIYPDCRSLVVAQTRDPVDALFVALPPHQALDLLPPAAERGLSLFCHAPMGRSVEELRHVRDIFSGMSRPAVLSERWSAGLDTGAPADWCDLIGRLFSMCATVASTSTGVQWRGHRDRAGGGALLYDGYEALHAMVSVAGLPEAVSAECSLTARPGIPATRDTEDAAALTLRFARDIVGSLAVCRNQVDAAWTISLSGCDGSAAVSPDGMVIRRLDAEEPLSLSRFGGDGLAADVARFGERCRRHCDDTSFKTDLTPHMHTLATIEAAYLSARTGTPEAPKQFVQTYS